MIPLNNLYISKSRNGLGLFSKNPIKKEEVVCQILGKKRSVFEVDQIIGGKISANAYRFSKEEYISPEGEMGDYINHSCNPSAFIKKKDQQLFVLALREILAGEEITIDYSLIMADDDEWSILCNCGEPLFCRGKILKFILLPSDVKVKYFSMGIVPDYIKS